MSLSRVLLVLPRPEESAEIARDLAESGFECQMLSGERPDPEVLAHADCDAWLVDPEAWKAGDVLTLSDERGGAPAVVLLTSFGTVGDAVDALRRGAAEYLTRPVSPERLALALRRAIDQRRLRSENDRLRESLGGRFDLGRILSRDPRMHEIRELVASVADTRANLLISGESGTGKTLLARAIHQRSSRAHGPFVEVNCGALPPTLLESELFGHARGAFTGAVRDKVGRFEAADGGTIFLDEIATAPADLQIKLLRVLQDRVFERVGDHESRTVDVRVIAASNRDLADEARAGRFREDLYWRLAVVPIHLPPLRERASDVPLLAQTFVEKFAAEHGRSVTGIDPAALALLCRAPWPGNVRQLENTIERAVLVSRGGALQARDLGPELALETPFPPPVLDAGEPGPVLPLKRALEGPERALILRALERNGGNRARTAAMLGVNRTTLFNKMRKYDLLEPAPGRAEPPPPPGHAGPHPAR